MMQSAPPASRAVLFLLLAAVPACTASAQSTPAAGQQPAPKGKVLFERHESAATPDSTNPPSEETAPGAPGAAGISSSSRRSRTTLRRRSEPAADSAAPTVEQPAVPVMDPTAVASSSRQEEAGGPVVLTAADRDAARRVSAAQRLATTITADDLDLHLNAHTGEAVVRAQLTVRNSSAEPLAEVPVRISGALRWESVRLAGSAVTLQQYHLQDDLDHTGFATELTVPLQTPLLPGASVSLDLYYGGTLAGSTQRLTALGAPEGRAALTDWDTVSDTFTGLRGLGSVLWYPVSGATALLRDGDAVTEAVQAGRVLGVDSRVSLRLTLEYSGSRPEAAFFCGKRQALQPFGEQAGAEAGFVTAEWRSDRPGTGTPSLFIAGGAAQEAASGLVRVTTDRADTVSAAGEAAARIRPMLAEWLGAAPAHPLEVLDLPIPGAAGFAEGSLLVVPLTTAPAAVLATSLVQPLAVAWLPPEIRAAWLREGLPAFLQAVWEERTSGRDAAMAALAAGSRHTEAAPGTQGISSSQPAAPEPALVAAALAVCSDAPCARIKGAYVFEMLRNMLGDSGLQQAISGWAVQQSQQPGRSAADETAAMEALLQRVAGKRDLKWFFANWVDADHGLPDLRIVTVAPRRVERSTPVLSLPQARRPVAGPIGAEPVAPTDPRDMNERDAEALSAASGGGNGPAPGSWLVAVEVQNSGSADAEVPVTVRAGGLTNTLPLRVAAHSRATVRVPFEADPAEVLVNDGSVPEAVTAIHRKRVGSLPVAP